MINNWDIISRLDPQTRAQRYVLVTDGTEQDAFLMLKKLQGYTQQPEEALAPYVYAFSLPETLDEETLEKIRTAVAECVEQSRKVSEFVPNGVLGNPLFNTKEEKKDSFMEINPEDSFLNGKQNNTVPVEEQKISVPETPEVAGLEKNTIATPEAPSDITINDRDMLIKDMEGTMLDNIPLEDIFAAETKYDMFLDLENQKLVKNTQDQRNQKLNNLADGKDSLENTFNVFEQKIKDQTCVIDLDALNALTDQLDTKAKNNTVVEAASPTHHTEEPPVQTPPAPANEIHEPVLAKEEKEEHAEPSPVTEEKDNLAPSATDVPVMEEIPEIAVRPQAFSFEENTENNTPAATEEDKTPAWVDPLEEILPSVTLPKPKVEVPSPSILENASDFNIETEDSPQGVTGLEVNRLVPQAEETFTEPEMPEETSLGNTLIPGSHKTLSEVENTEELPEITIRGQKIDELEKTFNLETTIEPSIMRTQYEKSFHRTQDAKPTPAVQKTEESGATEKVENKEKKRIKQTVLRLKTKPVNEGVSPLQALLQNNEGELNMEENKEEKTTFRIRRKALNETAAPVPPAPQAPAAPVAPVSPAPQPVRPTQPLPAAPQTPSAPKAEAPQPAAANTILEKTKTIDHSIEIPLHELKKHNWPLEVPLVPTYTLENMVMSVNRFAHATAVSVIDNPGKLYNPLVLHGATGTGKTHFLNAMAYAFSKKYGQENIFMTNGVRLSRGVQRYVMEGNMEKFEKFMDTVKVLLIDDIHLLAVNEQNRKYISELLNKFLREQKQIVITSKYPPESLAKLEELIKFRLDSGWISELKPAGGATHFKIVKKMLIENGVDLNDSQINTFFGGAHMTLGTVNRSVRRLKVLENLIFPNLPEEDRSQAHIFEKLLATTGEDGSSELLSHDIDTVPTLPLSSGGEWGKIGFFYPQTSSHMMNWMMYALQQRAKELGVPGGFELAVRSSYATENIISSAFKIANLCDNKKLKGAVILGPALTVADRSVRENFYDILTHMLEVMLIRCGIINFEDAKAPSTYVKVISELLR